MLFVNLENEKIQEVLKSQNSFNAIRISFLASDKKTIEKTRIGLFELEKNENYKVEFCNQTYFIFSSEIFKLKNDNTMRKLNIEVTKKNTLMDIISNLHESCIE